MERYFGHISGSMGFGKPTSLLIRMNGYAGFTKLAEHIHTEKIEPYLRERKWNLNSSRLLGSAPVGDAPIEYKTIAKDVGLEDKLGPGMPVKKVEIGGEETYVPDHDIKAHEENHKEIMSLGLWDKSRYSGQASAYFTIITESLADVLGDLETLVYHSDKEAMNKHMRLRSEFGWELLGIVSEAQHGKTHKKLRDRIKNAYNILADNRENPTWGDITNDLGYHGLYGACLDLILTHGERRGKEIVYETIHKLQDAPDALDALAYLLEKLTNPRSLPPIKELSITPNRLSFEHTASSGDSLFGLYIWCPGDAIPVSYAKALIASTKKVTDQVLVNIKSQNPAT